MEKRKIDVFLFRYISDKVFLPKSFLLYFFGGKCITISIWQKKKYSFFTFLEKVLKKFEVFLTIVNKIAIKIGKIVHLHNNFEKSSKILAKKLAKNNFFSKNCNFFSDFGHYAYNIIVKNECFWCSMQTCSALHMRSPFETISNKRQLSFPN